MIAAGGALGIIAFHSLRFRRSWWARQDSNLQPSGYEPPALTIELRARRVRRAAPLEHFRPK